MPFIPTADTVRVALRYSLFGQDVVNTLWFHDTGLGQPDQTAILALVNSVMAWAESDVLPLLSSNISLVDVTGIAQWALDAPSLLVLSGQAGGDTGASMPGSVCVTIKFNTAQRGRSGRGRNYISGINEALVTGNAVSTTFANNLLLAYGALVSAPPSGWEWVVVSHYLDKEARAAGFIQQVTTPSIVDLNVDSQRRRLTGRGS